MCSKKISKSVIERIPLYLNYLEKVNEENILMISSKTISDNLGLGEVQVRKDLNLISGNGKPKIGYVLKDLKQDLEQLIRSEQYTNIIIIGAGNIGEALARNFQYEKPQFRLIGIFDNDSHKINSCISNIIIQDINTLASFCEHHRIDIAIICVPGDNAQDVCDIVVKNNIKGILNFTNTYLNVNKNINIRNVDITSLLTMIAIEINNNKGENIYGK